MGIDPQIQEPARPTSMELRHLSWSGLQTYQTCPRRFYYRYIAGVPEESRSAALVFGSAIHKAIESIHEARIAGEMIPAIPALLAAHDKEWSDASQNGPEIVFANKESAATLRELAQRMLEAYREHVVSERGEVIGIEHEALFRMLSDAPPLKARIDLLEKMNGDLTVTDFKTSRSRWSESKIRESVPQLIVYARAAMPILRELGAKRIRTRFVVLIKARRPVVQIVEPQATTDDEVRLKTLVAETWHAIKQNAFLRREGWQCAQCSFAQRCLGHGVTH